MTKFSMILPPPNITGSLHIGHALNITLQDVMARHAQMNGKDVNWVAGMDHAGIATQMVVERHLEQIGAPGRKELGRANFLDKIWEWKELYGGKIRNQSRKLNSLLDFEDGQYRFTLDAGSNVAVKEAFVTLYRDGLIYKDKRLVNWDTKFQTAISDLEVEMKEEVGIMYDISYEIIPGGHITVSTTRPETMFGDVAIAVNPDDDRYSLLIGSSAIIPWSGKRIKIVADPHADPEKGTGAVKITPAHDFNDYEVAKRHNITDMPTVIDESGRMNDECPAFIRGKTVTEARTILVKMLRDNYFLVGEHEVTHSVPYGDRSGTVIEPRLTDQWYLDAKLMSEAPLAAVQAGETKFVPEHWTQTYYDWIKDIRPWCISRQLWWGHRIPAWYGPNGDYYVAHSEQEAKENAEVHYGYQPVMVQDEDVLDTWFSSALWPLTTSWWPDNLEDTYPLDTLVTGHDIIFFWVSRMMMFGKYFTGKMPFAEVFINALVCDEFGQKMTKTKGNVVDPLDMIEKFGTDALRFYLTFSSGQNRTINFSEAGITRARNFITKIRNAHTFLTVRECFAKYDRAFDPDKIESRAAKWIRDNQYHTESWVSECIRERRFDQASETLIQYIWNLYCDWGLEFSKALNSKEFNDTLVWAFGRIVAILAPFIPETAGNLSYPYFEFSSTAWPDTPPYLLGAPQGWDAEIQKAIDMVLAIRPQRAEFKIPPKTKLKLNTDVSLTDEAKTIIMAMAGIGEIAPYASDKGDISFAVGYNTASLTIGGHIDVPKEIARLNKALVELDKNIIFLGSKLSDAEFTTKAPDKVIADFNERLMTATTSVAAIKTTLANLE